MMPVTFERGGALRGGIYNNEARPRPYPAGRIDDFRLHTPPDFGGSPDGIFALYEADMSFTGFKPVTAARRILQTVVLVTLYDPQSSDDFLLMGSAGPG
jgi:hypothetical protein